MDPAKHAKLWDMYGYVSPVSGALSVFLLMMTSFKFFWLIIVFVWGVMLIGYMILRYLPVYCDKPGCNGRMMFTRSRKSFSNVENRYECQDCGSIYLADTFSLESKGGFHGGGGGP